MKCVVTNTDLSFEEETLPEGTVADFDIDDPIVIDLMEKGILIPETIVMPVKDAADAELARIRFVEDKEKFEKEKSDYAAAVLSLNKQKKKLEDDFSSFQKEKEELFLAREKLEADRKELEAEKLKLESDKKVFEEEKKSTTKKK